MSTRETIYVANIRCGGCMKTIKEALKKLPGVGEVDILQAEEKVTVTGTGIHRDTLAEKLASLGYPEKGNNSILYKAKSLISCAAGKMS